MSQHYPAPAAHLQLSLQPHMVQQFPFLRYQVSLRASLRANLLEMLFRQQTRNSHELILATYTSYKSKSPDSGQKPSCSGT